MKDPARVMSEGPTGPLLPTTPDQGWGKELLMKLGPWVGASNVFKEKNPGFVLMIRGKEKTRECPSESVRESTHLEKLVE